LSLFQNSVSFETGFRKSRLKSAFSIKSKVAVPKLKFWNSLYLQEKILMNALYVIIGGGIGAVLRYFSTQFINSSATIKFPLGTLFVNCIGALLIGFLINIFDLFSINIKWKLFLITGFLGGYTTFSTYSLETIQYFMSGNIKYAVINILLNNVLCLLFVLLGMWLNKLV
jgi:CrcB protein